MDSQQQTVDAVQVAARKGDIDLVKKLLSSITDLEVKDQCCKVAIEIGNKEDHKDIVAEALATVADPKVKEKCMVPALECFARHGATVTLMLQTVTDPEVKSECCSLGIYAAATRGHMEIVTELLEAVTDMTMKNQLRQQALSSASVAGHEVIVKQLLRTITDQRDTDQCCMLAVTNAAKFGHMVLANELLQTVADERIKEQCCWSAIFPAVKNGHADVVALLLRAVGDATIRDKWCQELIKTAVIKGHRSVVNELLQAVSSTELRDKFCDEVISVGHSHDRLDIIIDVLRAVTGQEMKNRCYSKTIVTVSMKGRADILTDLLHSARNMKFKDQWCKEAIEDAAKEGHWEIVNQLLQEISDSKTRDKCYQKSIRGAAISGRHQFVSWLLQAITNSKVKDRCCLKAVAVAARKGHQTVLSELLSAVTDYTVRDQCYKDAVLGATTKNRQEMVVELLKSITDTEVHSSCCKEAITKAAVLGHVQLVALVLQCVTSSEARVECCKSTVETAVIDSRLNYMSDLLQCLTPDLRNECYKIAVHTAILRFRSDSLNFLMTMASEDKGNTIQLPRLNLSDPNLLLLLNGDAVKGDNGNLKLVISLCPEHNCGDALIKSISLGHVSLAISILTNATNIDFTDSQGAIALSMAAQLGHDQILHALLQLSRKPPVNAEDNEGHTAMSRACSAGHVRAVKVLLDGGAELQRRDAQLAMQHGHSDLCNYLLWKLDGSQQQFTQNAQHTISRMSDNEAEDQKLSITLHQLLTDAGFTAERVMFQIRMAKFIQAVAGKLTKEDIEMTGSFAEGWGNSLVNVNGRTAPDSDIDWTVIVPGVILHLQEGCECRGDNVNRLPVNEGHVVVDVAAGSSPAVAAGACGVRPAMDTCHAFQCCSEFCRDRCSVLCHEHQKVHLVRATRPNSNHDLRVSFSFHEKLILRQLETVQGQLFILLKFIFKRLLPRMWKTPGLKTYNAKTLLFHIMERHSDSKSKWQPENLISLLKESLDLMLHFLTENTCPDVCMPHFFMPDAPLFVKNAGIGGTFLLSKSNIVQRLIELRGDMSQLYQLISNHVRPLRSQKFYCHPFTLLPLVTNLTLSEVEEQKADAIIYVHYSALVYTSVASCLTELQSQMPDKKTLIKQVNLLPDSMCSTVKLCLSAIVHLKFGDRKEAIRLLAESYQHSIVSPRSIQSSWDAKQSISWEEFFELVARRNWAWRFCFAWHSEDLVAKFHFLPEATKRLITVRHSSQSPPHLYVNFRNLWWSLAAELLPQLAVLLVQDWLKELQEDLEDAEFVELETLCDICFKHSLQQQAEQCVELMQHVVTDQKEGVARGDVGDEEKLLVWRSRLQR